MVFRVSSPRDKPCQAIILTNIEITSSMKESLKLYISAIYDSFSELVKVLISK
jgi:hypothetical protein